MIKILIIGLAGSGKTTLAKILKKNLDSRWINGDLVRKKYNDWDFSKNGIKRQLKRIAELANTSKKKYVVIDFICPFETGRALIKPDILIWMDTIKQGRFVEKSIDHLFEKPSNYTFRVKKKNSVFWAKKIIKHINTINKL
jgi:adenylylsulfate kinase